MAKAKKSDNERMAEAGVKASDVQKEGRRVAVEGTGNESVFKSEKLQEGFPILEDGEVKVAPVKNFIGLNSSIPGPDFKALRKAESAKKAAKAKAKKAKAKADGKVNTTAQDKADQEEKLGTTRKINKPIIKLGENK